MNVSARDVVEDLKALKQGRFKNGDKSPLISPSGRKNFDSQSSPRMHAQLENSKDETSSTSSDKHEKDVNVLNRLEFFFLNLRILFLNLRIFFFKYFFILVFYLYFLN